jgi:hypothetical protein
MTATKALANVRSTAETIRNDDPATVDMIEPGDVVRQGDVYLVALDKPLAGKPFGSCQLAPGSTQGSRHVVVGKCKVQVVIETDAVKTVNRLVPATKGKQLFIGPQVIAPGPVTIEHPEHGHRTLPAGTYLTVYQRAWSQEIRRQLD